MFCLFFNMFIKFKKLIKKKVIFKQDIFIDFIVFLIF
jgi:hypothetical protein